MLNNEQIQQVKIYLSNFKKLKSTHREELLDHICCDIEQAMEGGQSFRQALAANQERCNENEVKKIHSSNQNQLIMAKLLFSVLMLASLALGAISLFQAHEPQADAVELQGAAQIEPPSICPLSSSNFKLSSTYGLSVHPLTKKERMHKGVDWKAPLGTPIQSAGDGVVLEAGQKGNYGNCIIIVHDEIYQTLYAHLQKIDVKVGDRVTLGQQIGSVGTTGMSTGPHLHYEVIRNGVKVNPVDYLP